LCLIHGNWHDGSCWEPLLPRLRARGHDAVTPDLPFDRPNTSYQERARPAWEALTGVTGSLVVVGHSRGSAEAGLVATQRDADLLVHLCPRLGEFAAPDGAPSVYRSGFPYPPRRDDGATVWEPDAAIAAMYPRTDPITAHELQRPHRRIDGVAVDLESRAAAEDDVQLLLRCPRSAHHRSAMSGRTRPGTPRCGPSADEPAELRPVPKRVEVGVFFRDIAETRPPLESDPKVTYRVPLRPASASQQARL
jgi:pimeloyl-ACP methyl ester carboxylesterase